MKLTKLTYENSSKLYSKNIICYEKSSGYIDELQIHYPTIYRNIVGIADDYRRNQGLIDINGKEIEVKDTAWLINVNWSDTVLLITSDYYEEAFEKIQSLIEKDNQKEDITVYYFANKETLKELQYKEKFSDMPIDNHLIIFSSGPHIDSYVKGMDFADNSRALFEHMISVGLNLKYRLVWFVKYPDEFNDKYSKYKNVKFISFDWRNSDLEEELTEYYKTLFTAKYIFFTDAYGFARNCRKEQIRVQLWHGCGFKTRTNFVPCEKRYEYNIVISDIYQKIHMKIYGLRQNQVKITGYPKADWLFHPISIEKRRKLGIPDANKYIFWLPTFRIANESLSNLNERTLKSETGLPILNTDKKLNEINNILKKYNMMLVIKIHPFQNRSMVKINSFSNIIILDNEVFVKEDVQINQLLGWADAMISDYSSSAVDYLILNRPIAYTLDDVYEYESSRGFVFDNIRDWLAGEEIWGMDDYLAFVEEIGNNQDKGKNKREIIFNKMHYYHDDKSSERVLRELNICE